MRDHLLRRSTVYASVRFIREPPPGTKGSLLLRRQVIQVFVHESCARVNLICPSRPAISRSGKSTDTGATPGREANRYGALSETPATGIRMEAGNVTRAGKAASPALRQPGTRRL